MIDFGYGLYLHTIDKDDLRVLRLWRNDYRTWKWCRQNDLISESDQMAWYERQSQDPKTKMYLILSLDKIRLGVCGFTSLDPWNRRAEFSLYIGPSHRSNGYGKKALKTLIAHGMYNLGLNSIWGESFSGNPAIQMFQDLGFKDEGVSREAYYREGKFIDCHRISMTRSDWEFKLRENKESCSQKGFYQEC